MVSGKLNNLLYFAILGYITSIFLPNAPVIVNFFMVAIFVLAWLDRAISYKLSPVSLSKNRVNIGLCLFFLFQFVSVLFSSDKSNGFDILRLRITLFILPLAFCAIDFEQKKWHNILVFYVFATVAASVAGFAYGVYMAIHEHNSGYLYNDNISCLLIGKQAAYFGFYINCAIFALIYLLSQKAISYKPLAIGFLIWLIFINYMLASTMSNISLWLILLFMAVVQIIRKKKILQGAILVFGLIIGVVVLNQVFPKSLVRFQRITHTNFRFDNTNPENHFDAEYNPDEWNSAGTRLALWQCGSEIWLKHPIMGTGLGDLRNALKDKYTEKEFWFALNTKRNLHSQYMDILVSMGIIGLLVFLATFIFYPVKTFLTHHQTFALCVFACVAFCLLTENMFDRYQGEVLIGFMLPLSAKVFDKKEKYPIRYQQDTY